MRLRFLVLFRMQCISCQKAVLLVIEEIHLHLGYHPAADQGFADFYEQCVDLTNEQTLC